MPPLGPLTGLGSPLLPRNSYTVLFVDVGSPDGPVDTSPWSAWHTQQHQLPPPVYRSRIHIAAVHQPIQYYQPSTPFPAHTAATALQLASAPSTPPAVAALATAALANLTFLGDVVDVTASRNSLHLFVATALPRWQLEVLRPTVVARQQGVVA